MSNDPIEEETRETWYAAHVLLYVELLDGAQDHYTVWENIYLISAQSDAEAFDRAEALGRLEEKADEDSGHTADGRPARFRYAGIRRLAECIDFENGPEDGREVTYIEYTVRRKKALDMLLATQACPVVIESPPGDGAHPELLSQTETKNDC
jgi:hypothetical protein